ncbi:MAG: CDP-archaeol synthase [Candidatus Anstonellaceae archaeon]
MLYSLESIIGDILLIAPLHITNDLLFLTMRWKLLGKIHCKDRPVSQRLFGTHRTWIGLLFIFASNAFFYAIFTGKILLLPGIGAIIGVHASSLIKRGIGIKEGQPLPVADQLDFVIGGIFGLALSGIYLSNLYLMLAFSFVLHLVSNIAAYFLGLKEVWW